MAQVMRVVLSQPTRQIHTTGVFLACRKRKACLF
jgi:hypothetical protein